MLSDPHPVWGSPQNLRHLQNIQLAEHPQQQQFSVFIGQRRRDQIYSFLSRQAFNDFRRRVAGILEGDEELALSWCCWATTGRTTVIGRSPTGNREDPRSKTRQVTVKTTDAASQGQPYIARQIVGGTRLEAPQEAQQPGL